MINIIILSRALYSATLSMSAHGTIWHLPHKWSQFNGVTPSWWWSCHEIVSFTLHYITLHYITLHYITLHYITLHYITLHYITLQYISLHYITLHYITLHYITLHYITYITSHHITSHHITSHHITSHHITSHHLRIKSCSPSVGSEHPCSSCCTKVSVLPHHASSGQPALAPSTPSYQFQNCHNCFQGTAPPAAFVPCSDSSKIHTFTITPVFLFHNHICTIEENINGHF